MAYLPMSEKEKEEEGQQAGGQPIVTAGSPNGTIGGGGGGASAQASTSGTGAGSTGFVNLQRYIDSNKPGIERMTDTGVAKIGDIGSQAQSAAQNLQTAFDTASSQGRVQTNQNLLNQLKNDPTKITSNKDNLAAFQRMQSGQYEGPKSFADLDDFQNTQSQVSALDNKLRQTETSGGRFNMLRDLFGDQRYTQGENRLDQAFLQADPTSQGKLQQTRETLRPTVDQFGNALTASQGVGSQYAQEAAATNQATQNALNQQWTDRNATLQNQLAAQQAANKRAYQAELARLAIQFNLSKFNFDLGSQAPMTEAQRAARIVDPTKFLQQGQQVQLGNILDQNTAAQMQAFATLGGQDPSQFDVLGQVNPFSFNQQGYDAAIQQQAQLIAQSEAAQRAEQERQAAAEAERARLEQEERDKAAAEAIQKRAPVLGGPQNNRSDRTMLEKAADEVKKIFGY